MITTLASPQAAASWLAAHVRGALRTDRDRAMVALMVLVGLRRCEVLGLSMADIRSGEQVPADPSSWSPPVVDQYPTVTMDPRSADDARAHPEESSS